MEPGAGCTTGHGLPSTTDTHKQGSVNTISLELFERESRCKLEPGVMFAQRLQPEDLAFPAGHRQDAVLQLNPRTWFTCGRRAMAMLFM